MEYSSYSPTILFDTEAGGAEHPEIGGYKVKMYKAGPQMELHIYPCWATKGMAGQARREQRTRIAQQKGDERRARQKLDRIVAANFEEYTDYKVGLDYETEPTPEQAEKDIKALIRALRKEYKKLGIPLKYIYVSQIITPTGRIRKRIHHHMIMTGGIEYALLRELWPHGRAHIDVLQPDGNGLAGLSAYLAGHVHGTKRWAGSRNLTIPQPQYVKPVSKRAVRAMEDYEAARTLLEKRFKKYAVCSIDIKYSDVVPGAYIYARMRMRDAWKLWKRR